MALGARTLTTLDLPEGLADLHTHLGGSVASEIMWSLAHEQGILLPVKDYWAFDRLVTVSDPRGVPDLDATVVRTVLVPASMKLLGQRN